MHHRKLIIRKIAIALLIGLPFLDSNAEMGPSEIECPTVSPKSSKRVTKTTAQEKFTQNISLTCGANTNTNTISFPSIPSNCESKCKSSEETPQVLWVDSLIKLISSLIWPLVIIYFLWRFRPELAALINRTRQVKIGDNHLLADLHTTPPAVEADKATREYEDLKQEGSSDNNTTQSTAGKLIQKKDFLLIEDLALRAVQADYATPIRRHLTGGRDPGFDGVFSINDTLIIIEVKYFRNKIISSKVQETVHKLECLVRQYGWPKVQLMLVVVYDNINDSLSQSNELIKHAKTEVLPVIVKTYLLQDLEARFSVNASAEG